VDTFQDATRALDAFHQRSYDLVLADARMRRVDGLEFTARLQELAGIEKLPVVVVDDRANSATERAAQVAGASAYIVKPVSWDDAGELLSDMMDATNWRRFVRYGLRLPVEVRLGSSNEKEITQTVARGGISLRTRRELVPGSIDRYRLRLPHPLPTVEVDGAAVMCLTQPGAATLLTGLRFLHFHGDGETHWIRLIEELARRTANRRLQSR
jgi:CheY-like chemotaxis protein